MTVIQLAKLLSWMPENFEVTDICGNPVSDVFLDEDCLSVRLDTDYIFEDQDKD